MKKMKMTVSKRVMLVAALVALVACLIGCGSLLGGEKEEYTFTNPEVERTKPDEGFKIDGVLDEEGYKNANWLYLNNVEAGNNVNVGVTSQFGQQGMYLVFDVTESVPIYVNPSRSSVLNSCIEFYLAPGNAKSDRENNFFEIDLLPTGQVFFKKTNGKWGYINATTTDDIMAYMGATTKGGPVNTEDCYGYCLELFIPWAYLEWLDVDVDQMKDHVSINVAHITSFNYTGTDAKLDRHWYQFIDKIGVGFSDVGNYFKFNAQGAMNTLPITFEQGEHYTITGTKAVLSGMSASFTVTPENGYAVTTLLIDGQERIKDAVYNKDGSVTINIDRVEKAMTVSADTKKVVAGNKNLSGQVQVHYLFGADLQDVTLSCNGAAVAMDKNGNFKLDNLAVGYYELVVEKPGFDKLTRSIYLTEDTHLALDLKYDLFYYNNSTYKNWNLDDQNKGVVYKTNGEAHILTKDSFDDFTFETTIKYDAALASAGTGDLYTQQRMGMRIVFGNGKIWYIHILNESGTYRLQYAGFSSAIFNWKNAYKLNTTEIAKLQSAEGIKLKVVRQGNKAVVYLDDVQVGAETLATEYADLSAQLGLDAWVANETPVAIPFSITK